jgi:hypothetical protein
MERNMNKFLKYFFGFAICLVYLSFHTSRTIGFGPNGVAAASLTAGGLINPPGYPLYTLICDLMMSIFGKTAFVLNLVSAFFAAVSIFLIALLSVFIFSKIKKSSANHNLDITFITFVLILIFCLLNLTGSPLFVSETYFANRYTLNLALILFSILLSINFINIENTRISATTLFFLFFLLGLSFGVHYSAVPLILCSIGYFFVAHRYFPKFKTIIFCFSSFIVGLTPYFYIWNKASHQPLMNWSDPENWNNFKNMIFRFQYGGVSIIRSYSQLMAQFERQYIFLFAQFQWFTLLFAIIGLVFVFKKNIKLGLYFLIILFITGELCTVGMNFTATNSSSLILMSSNSIMGEYYLPYYSIVVLLGAIGLMRTIFFLEEGLKSLLKVKYSKAILLVTFVGICIPLYYRSQSMSQRYFKMSDEYVRLVKSVTPSGSLILTNIDSFYFPLLYDQLIISKENDRLIIHTELLKMSWYLPTLKKIYGDKLPVSIADDLQKYLVEYEHGDREHDQKLNDTYYEILNGLIKKFDAKSNAYVIYHPKMNLLAPGLLGNKVLQPLHFGFRLQSQMFEMESHTMDQVNFESFKPNPGYPWTNFISSFIADLALRWVQEFQDLEPQKAKAVLSKIRSIANPEQIKIIDSGRRITL